MHTVAVSTWNHVERVEKNAYATPKQTQRNKLNPKQNPPLKQSCGATKTATPTQRTKSVWRQKTANTCTPNGLTQPFGGLFMDCFSF
jgi:hypothetical protein